MSPATKRAPKPPPPPKPWQRAEAGRYRSSDGRFTLESGSGQWFVTDDETLDELGLARTTGPFTTLDAAKAAADGARSGPVEASPLAARIAEAASRPTAEARDQGKPPGSRRSPASESSLVAARAAARVAAPAPVPQAAPAEPAAAESAAVREPEPALQAAPVPQAAPAAQPAPAPPPRTWLDDLHDTDRPAALRTRKLIAALEREGIADAETLVRRDLLGGTPAVVTRLLAREVLAAIASLKDPSAAQVAEAVAASLASSPKRGGLPGWELTERDGPTGARRSLRLTAVDLRAAAENEADR